MQVRKSAKHDRTRWLDTVLENGDWQQIRLLRKPRKLRCGRLLDDSGSLVESDAWADTMADHLEKVQWMVRPLGAVNGLELGPDLPVNLDSFTEDEVAKVVKRLRQKRAAGPDDIPAEFWHAVSEKPSGLTCLTMLCNRCWNDEEIPHDWRTANVTCIHKKGPVEDRDNYRPISLVCVAYKLFASLLLQRLLAAGAEDRLTDTQLGFRRRRGTNDAVFAARRHIDLALASRAQQCLRLTGRRRSIQSMWMR